MNNNSTSTIMMVLCTGLNMIDKQRSIDGLSVGIAWKHINLSGRLVISVDFRGFWAILDVYWSDSMISKHFWSFSQIRSFLGLFTIVIRKIVFFRR